VIHRVMVL